MLNLCNSQTPNARTAMKATPSDMPTPNPIARGLLGEVEGVGVLGPEGVGVVGMDVFVDSEETDCVGVENSVVEELPLLDMDESDDDGDIRANPISFNRSGGMTILPTGIIMPCFFAQHSVAFGPQHHGPLDPSSGPSSIAEGGQRNRLSPYVTSHESQ